MAADRKDKGELSALQYALSVVETTSKAGLTHMPKEAPSAVLHQIAAAAGISVDDAEQLYKGIYKMIVEKQVIEIEPEGEDT